MSKVAFRRFFNSVTGSLPQMLRAIDVGLIAINAVLGVITLNYHEWEITEIGMLIGFHFVYLLLSLNTPLQQPLWKRRGYVCLCMCVIAGATFLRFDFKLVLFWWIVKSCFLLPRQEVILAAIGAGVVYLAGIAWSVQGIVDQMADTIARRGVRSVFQPQVLLLDQLMFYLGASSLAVVLGFLILSERQSRQRTEALTQQVETLAAALERARIARDIHDSLGHTLTGLGIQLEAVQKLQHCHPEQAQRSLTTAQQLADQCLQDVRRSLSTLRQSDFDLNAAIAALVEQSQHQGFTIQLDFRLPQLPLQMSHQIYCVVQEGLMNVQKHAHATQVSLSGLSRTDAILIELKDNGQGFDLAQPNLGFGVRGMEERVQILGGQFKLESTLGLGTLVRITIPLQFAENAAMNSSQLI